jgi:protease-4
MTMQGQATPFSSTADYLVDRRRLRRRVFFWRIAAFLACIVAVVGVAVGLGGGTGAGPLQPHIARVAITGLITGDEATLQLIRDVANSRAEAVILSIDSPGGTTTGAELVYDEIRRLAAKKPVVAVVGTLAASGAYIAALGADEIFSRGNSLVGSIGVLFEYPNVGGLLDKVGVKFESIKSSPLKAAPNGLEPTSDAARAAMAALVADSYNWFKDLVKERRKLSDAELAQVDDGRVFTGRQGVPLKLVDAIGGQREAIAWLEEHKSIPKGLPVRDWKPRGSFGFGMFGLAKVAADALGMSSTAQVLERAATELDGYTLDGLVSIWQVGPNT